MPFSAPAGADTSTTVEPAEPIAHLLRHGVAADGVRRVLRTVRRHLKMDVAFLSRFEGDRRVFEVVDDDDDLTPIRPGSSMPLDDGYCLKVVTGELPACIPDTAALPAALDIAATRAVPIGAHLSVPVRLDTGDIYGTLCCFSYGPRPTLGDRDVQTMRAFAEVLAHRIDERDTACRSRDRAADEIRTLLARGLPQAVYQPIHRLADGALVGFECLSRFDVEPRRRPDEWFALAHRSGLGIDLESRAILHALPAQARLPAPLYLALNASAELLTSRRLETVLAACDPSRTVLELTEHGAVDDYERLGEALRPWRERGLRLAIDDAGAGYASMRHILRLDPDVIKLDMSLTHDIDHDRKRRALARGLIAFAHEIGIAVTAEGVETEGELETLRDLGADQAQGYHLARPGPLAEALRRAGVTTAPQPQEVARLPERS